MTENAQPLADGAGIPYYEKQRTQLHNLINKKKQLERNLSLLEDSILKKETEYLEDTPHGNIITGFEGYTKGGSTMLGQRRRGTLAERESSKVFSRSSVTFTGNGETPAETAASTPAAAMAPTPLSTAFVKGEGGASTPTSSKSGGGGGAGKKHKKSNAGNEGDSDTDTRETKKVRTNFGVVRR